MAKKTEDEAILEKLDQILKVLGVSLASSLGPDATLTERAKLLKIAGIDNNTIAKLLRTTPKTISVVTAGVTKPR